MISELIKPQTRKVEASASAAGHKVGSGRCSGGKGVHPGGGAEAEVGAGGFIFVQ